MFSFFGVFFLLLVHCVLYWLQLLLGGFSSSNLLLHSFFQQLFLLKIIVPSRLFEPLYVSLPFAFNHHFQTLLSPCELSIYCRLNLGQYLPDLLVKGSGKGSVMQLHPRHYYLTYWRLNGSRNRPCAV